MASGSRWEYDGLAGTGTPGDRGEGLGTLRKPLKKGGEGHVEECTLSHDVSQRSFQKTFSEREGALFLFPIMTIIGYI